MVFDAIRESQVVINNGQADSNVESYYVGTLAKYISPLPEPYGPRWTVILRQNPTTLSGYTKEYPI